MKSNYINFNEVKDADRDELIDFVGYNRGVRDALFPNQSLEERVISQINFLEAILTFPDNVVGMKDSLRKSIEEEKKTLKEMK